MGLGACGVPAAFEPVAPAPHSAIALERFIEGHGSPHLLFTPDARLRTIAGATLRGRDAIQSYLSDPGLSGPRDFQFGTETVYRCGPERGIETGTYRAIHRLDGRLRVLVGRWYAEWRRVGARWAIDDGRLLGPGEPLPPIHEDCVTPDQEVRAEARFTATLQGAPFGFFTADPHHGLESLGRYPYFSESMAGPGVILSADYRLGRWLTVGGYAGRDPVRRTTYRLDQEREERLTSRLGFWALAIGYEGRVVSVDAGPARVRSRWSWSSTADVLIDEGTVDSRWGAVVTARAVQSLRWDLGLELMLQYRWFGSDVLPRAIPPLKRSRNGLFIGLGIALRRTP